MPVKWTPSQQNAIEAFGGKLVVSAGAGSGKTAVLIERAVKLITERAVPADSLLIITFTNSAAEELRTRLYAAIDKLCRAAPGDSELKRQSVLVRRAHIGTFDSYCKKLCAEHFNELSISPDFTLATGAFRDTLRDAAIEKTLEQMYDDPNFRALSDMFGKSRSDSGIEHLILDFNGFLEKLCDPDLFKSDCLFRLSYPVRLSESAFGRYLLYQANRTALYAVDLCQKGEAVSELDEDLERCYLPTFAALRDSFEPLCDSTGLGYDKAARIAAGITPIPFKPLRGDDFKEKRAAKEIKAEIIDQLKKIKEKYLFSSEREYARECALMLPAIQALFDSERLFSDNLRELKSRRRAYEFSDIDRLALSLLVRKGKPTELANELSKSYSAVMVDEYQDTDEIQSAVYNAISDGGQKLFIVGDSKQSIYRFRRAEPRIMLRERKAARPPEEHTFPMHIKLLENFRSESPVIDAVNLIFNTIMTERNGDIDYTREPLVAGRDPVPGIGLSLVINTSPDPNFQPRFISQKIRELMAADKGLRFSDFAIIASSIKDYTDDYSRVFKEEGVPLFCDLADTVYNTDEGGLLLSVMSAVENPLRDIDLCALLTTPGIGFGATELFKLRQGKKSGSLYPLLLADQSEQAKMAAEVISRLTFLKNRLPIDELAAKCVSMLRLDEWALSLPGGEYRLGNLYAFIDSAREAKAASDISLSRFITLAERAKQSDSADRRSPPPDTVIFKTIHTSKGLEWKYVFLAGAERRFAHDNSQIIFDSVLGIGANIIERSPYSVVRKKTAAFGALSVRNSEKSLSERVRLLYVALTRAKQRTYVMASTSIKSQPQQSLFNVSSGLFSFEELVSSCSSFYAWILLALMESNREVMCRFSLEPGITTLSCCEIIVDDRIIPVAAELPKSLEELPAEELDRLRERLEFVPPEAELSSIPAKQSVTSLVKEESDITIPRPSFAMARGLSSAERGTAMHMFMQFADYKKARSDPEAELLRLIDNSYISEAFAESIDTDRLSLLLKSDFFGELLSADRLLREYEFFLPVKASELAGRPLSPDGEVIIQGIADCIAITGTRATIVDYKSDAVQSEQTLIDRYSAQLQWYKRAAETALSVEVSGCYVYSFSLAKPVKII